MSIIEFGRDVFGVDPPAAPTPGQTYYHSPEQKKAFLARYYHDILTGRRRPPPPPPKLGASRPSAPSGGGGGGSLNISQTVDAAKQVPGVANAVSSVLSSLGSGLSNSDVDPNVSANVSINGEFFDDELTWPGHRHYSSIGSYSTGPVGGLDPFPNAEFGDEGNYVTFGDGMGFEEHFMCASNQLPAMVRG
jgi:hypothetical protein